ncbi:MAG: serine/threonine-protein kinase RsbT [Petroclostridium sp.]|jgi:anti-sigma regulatory factor (Ser/Thr protein kinase)|uniref:ATP-binding protein n=1 Tax=Petroclostridium xylanilyticum TaxID=1792311 RepID=UPI000B97DFCE|nr:anti-sigma regulatory factor [Petroclostridium xylanilyticum]MBZ4646432.1 anti-sigma regulatory factor [Clostridia bacterium]MDK2810508.1 serine/threonine-protein kinase RsbT [Petroclostridium sp.]
MTDEKNVISLHYEVDGEDFSLAGEASSNVKRILKQLGVSPEIIRRVSIAMYEGEMNMVIHANGGIADVEITPEQIKVVLQDDGPGIPDIELAMQEGYSTAPDNIRELGFGAGMGLPNMKKYTDYLDIISEVGKGTKVEMIVKVK